MTITVTTQAELDAALAANEATIYIDSPAGVWLTLAKSESSHVEAWESSHVVAWGSSHVEAWGSSHVVARESSHVVARGSSHVEAWESSHVVAWESSHVVAWESSHVVARGSSHVEAWESSHVVASAYVAVHLHSQRVTLKGGVVIDMTAMDETDPTTWCALHGVDVKRGTATLYKALDDNYRAGHDYSLTTYALGTTVTAADWRDDDRCGGGLHLGPTTSHATEYRRDASRWVAVEVKVADVRPILGGTAKAKVRTCRVVAEVDRYGDPVTR